MSVDSYHHMVEKGMHSLRNVYDFGGDFVQILEIDGKAILMKAADFINFPRGVSERSKFAKNKHMLANRQVAKFFLRSTRLFWKDSLSGEFHSAEFLKKAF